MRPLIPALLFCLYASSALASPSPSGFPSAPHGGKLQLAESMAGPKAGEEKFYLEVVHKGKRLAIYPYFLSRKASLAPIPRREIKSVVVRLGASDINTQKTLSSKLTTTHIEAVINERDPRFNTLIVTVDFKGDKPVQEARFALLP